MKLERGFTLGEALITVTVILILTTLAVPNFQYSLSRSKVRKTSDLITESIILAQNEALRRNVQTFLAVVGGNICIGTTVGGCDLRQEPLITGVGVSNTQLTLSPFYGIPNPAPASFTITYNGVSQTVTINKLGIVSVGAIS